MKPKTRRNLAWVGLVIFIVITPISPFIPKSFLQHGIWMMSGLALILTATDILATTDVRVKEEEDGEKSEEE